MKKGLLFGCLLPLILCGCTSSPTESDIREDIPPEISEVYFGTSPDPLPLNDVEITQSKTEDKEKTIDCAFTFGNEFLDYTSYWTLSYYQYDDGSWKLENWEPLKEPEAIPFQGPTDSDIDRAIERVNGMFYNANYTGIDVDLDADQPSAVMHFELNNTFGYMSENGVLDLVWYFSAPIGWDYTFDDSQLNRTWNIENLKLYHAEFGSILDTYGGGFTVNFFADDRFFRRLNGTETAKYSIGNTLSFEGTSGLVSDVMPSREFGCMQNHFSEDSYDIEWFTQFSSDQCLAMWSFPQTLDQDGLWEYHGTLWHRILICDDAIYYTAVGLDDDGKHYWGLTYDTIANLES